MGKLPESLFIIFSAVVLVKCEVTKCCRNSEVMNTAEFQQGSQLHLACQITACFCKEVFLVMFSAVHFHVFIIVRGFLGKWFRQLPFCKVFVPKAPEKSLSVSQKLFLLERYYFSKVKVINLNRVLPLFCELGAIPVSCLKRHIFHPHLPQEGMEMEGT